MQQPKIVAVVGATASGKSALALALARHLDAEIVSCDSMQIYRGMDIGTAKPSAAERDLVPHHLIDVAEPEQEFSAMDYALAAERAVSDILSRGRLPIFCGGTGLYLEAFLRGDQPQTPGADPDLRRQLHELAAQKGAQYLHALLAEVDPDAAKATHPNNVRRVVRALELYRTTGVTKTEWDRRSAMIPSRYDATVIGLEYTCRELLYDRIDQRVDQMIRQGLVEETKHLMQRGVFDVSRTASGAIGYKELLPYCKGECDLDTALEELKRATRRYAKRQITWFSAKPYVHWIRADDGTNTRKCEEIVNIALKLLENKNIMI